MYKSKVKPSRCSMVYPCSKPLQWSLYCRDRFTSPPIHRASLVPPQINVQYLILLVCTRECFLITVRCKLYHNGGGAVSILCYCRITGNVNTARCATVTFAARIMEQKMSIVELRFSRITRVAKIAAVQPLGLLHCSLNGDATFILVRGKMMEPELE
jgi:hypothetical protein